MAIRSSYRSYIQISSKLSRGLSTPSNYIPLTGNMRPKFLLAATFVVLLSAFVAVNRNRHPPRASHVDHLGRFEAIPIEGAVGPESFAFDPLGGGPYTGVSDGRIIKWQQDDRRWINFSRTSPERYAVYMPYPILKHVLYKPSSTVFLYLV